MLPRGPMDLNLYVLPRGPIDLSLDELPRCPIYLKFGRALQWTDGFEFWGYFPEVQGFEF